MTIRARLRQAFRGRRFMHVAADTRLVAIGDSHCKFWSGHDSVWERDRIPGLVTRHVGPALAWNLIERRAQTRAGPSVRRILHDLRAQHYRDWVLLCFGEIDLRAHVLKHAAHGELRAGVARLVDRYVAFVAEMRRIHPRLALWGPGASQPAGALGNADFPAVGSETQRNEATVLFTRLLDERAHQIGVPLLTLLPLLLDKEGQTRRELLYDGCHIAQALMPQALRLLTDGLGLRLTAGGGGGN